MKCPNSFIVGGDDDYHRPMFGKTGEFLRGTVVPCGKCEICQKNRASEWATRLQHESYYWMHKQFVTLTYQTMKLDLKDGEYELNHKHFQDFMKRLRKETKLKLRYFMCGEYGKKTLRPHFHIILFGYRTSFEDMEPFDGTYRDLFLEKIWKKGTVVVGQVTTETIYYTAGYMVKQIGSDTDELKGLKKPYCHASQGLGEQYAYDNMLKIRNLQLTNEGRSTPVPRYYLKKLQEKLPAFSLDRSRIIPQHTEKLLAYIKKIIGRKGIESLTPEERKILLKKIKQQRLANKKHLEKLQERKDYKL